MVHSVHVPDPSATIRDNYSYETITIAVSVACYSGPTSYVYFINGGRLSSLHKRIANKLGMQLEKAADFL